MAPKKRPVGRPKLPRGQERDTVLTLRLRPAERDRLQKVARRAEKALSAWARDVLMAQAEIGLA